MQLVTMATLICLLKSWILNFAKRGAVFVQRSHCEVQFLVLAFVWFGPLSTWKMPCQYMPVVYDVNTTFGFGLDCARYLFSSYLQWECSKSNAPSTCFQSSHFHSSLFHPSTFQSAHFDLCNCIKPIFTRTVFFTHHKSWNPCSTHI